MKIKKQSWCVRTVCCWPEPRYQWSCENPPEFGPLEQIRLFVTWIWIKCWPCVFLHSTDMLLLCFFSVLLLLFSPVFSFRLLQRRADARVRVRKRSCCFLFLSAQTRLEIVSSGFNITSVEMPHAAWRRRLWKCWYDMYETNILTQMMCDFLKKCNFFLSTWFQKPQW